MTIAFWCVLAAAVMPYILGIAAKTSKPKYDNAQPRNFLNSLEGWGERANWAHQNSLEAFPFFAAAVVIASMIGKINPATLDLLAIGFIVARVLYAFCYIANQASLRSLVWCAGLSCCISMLVLSA